MEIISFTAEFLFLVMSVIFLCFFRGFYPYIGKIPSFNLLSERFIKISQTDDGGMP